MFRRMLAGMELLALAWAAGLFFFFVKTSERGRENALLIAWLLLALPITFPFLRWMVSP